MVMSVGLVMVVSLPWSLANDLVSLEGVQTGPPALPPRSRGGWGGVVEPDRGEANWVWSCRVPRGLRGSRARWTGESGLCVAAWCLRLRCSLEDDELCELKAFRLGCTGFVGDGRLFGQDFEVVVGVLFILRSVLGDTLCCPVSLM